jgi:hypothetical protein
MISLLEEARRESESTKQDQYVGDILFEMYQRRFPAAEIPTRPYRLLKAAEQIAAPLRNGLNSVDDIYLNKLWIPRVRNKASMLLSTAFTMS